MRLGLLQLFAGTLFFIGINWQASADQTTVGWLERAYINGVDFQILAKIDTGADHSSINAKDAEVYTIDGKRWVKFKIKNRLGRETTINKRIINTTRIKMKDGKSQKRYVIKMDICLGTTKKRTRVNIVDRSHFKYQLLIGRSFLNPDFLVDSSQTHLVKPNCN